MPSRALDYYKRNRSHRHLSWQEIEAEVLRIVRKLKRSRFEPNIIISIARSGLIPASLISYCLGNKQLYVIKCDFSKSQRADANQDLHPRPFLTQRIKRSIIGLKVLVVDEMTVSGETLKLVSRYLHTKQPKAVKYAVLYRQPWSEFKPDYYGREVSFWPIYPWKVLGKTSQDPRELAKK